MPDILGMYAQSQPDKPGVIDDKPDGTVVTWTYAELDAQANRIGNLLLSLGVSPGQKVLWCGPNSPQVVAVMGATRKIGAVAVPLNYRLTPEEALYVINHSDAEVVYVDHEHAPMFAALRPQLEKVRHIIAVGGPAPEGMPTDAEDWLRLVDKYKVSSTFSAPALVRMICALPKEIKDRYDRSSMRVMIANAAPWSYALKQQYVADFPPESLFEVYGSTELGVDT